MLGWITLVILVTGLLIGLAFIVSSPSDGKGEKIKVLDQRTDRTSVDRHHNVPGKVVAVSSNGQYAYAVEDNTYRIASITANDDTYASHRIPHMAGESEMAVVRPYRLPNDTESFASYSVDGMTRDVLPCTDYTMFTRALQDENTGKWYGLHSNRAWVPLDGVPEQSVEVHLADNLTHGVAVDRKDVVSVLCRGVWTVDLRINGLSAVAENLYLTDMSRRVFRVTDEHGLESVCRLRTGEKNTQLIVDPKTMRAVAAGEASCKMFDLADGREVRNFLSEKSPQADVLSVAWDVERGAVYVGQPGRVIETSAG